MLLIENEDAQKLLNYLVERPYKEVHDLVRILMNLKPTEESQQSPPSQTKDT
jgi:hypothetical protein